MQYSSVYSLTSKLGRYSSVPNRCAGRNKRAGGKILKKNIKRAGQNRRAGRKFSGKLINMQWEIFWKINRTRLQL